MTLPRRPGLRQEPGSTFGQIARDSEAAEGSQRFLLADLAAGKSVRVFRLPLGRGKGAAGEGAAEVMAACRMLFAKLPAPANVAPVSPANLVLIHARPSK